VKLGFQDRLQVSFDDHLGDPVGNRWHAKRPGSSSISLRYVNATHRWREVTPGAHPIPDPIEVPFQVPVEILIVSPSTPAAPWFAFTCLYASHTSRLGIQNGFALSMQVIPFRVVR
jgi:hypothetical protein